MEADLTNQKVSKIVLLFPGTYIVHIAEEYWCGERFFVWLSRVADTNMTDHTFLLLNLIFFIIMLSATCLALFLNEHRIVPVLACIVLINALLHLFGSIITWSYSPGLISAIALWLPLSVWAFNCERKHISSKQMAVSVSIGFFVHLLVSFFALVNYQ